MEPFKWPPKSYTRRKDLVTHILWTLRIQGPVIDVNGQALQRLAELLADQGVIVSLGNMGNIMRELAGDHHRVGGFIKRECRGKRTYRIELSVDPSQVPFPPSPYQIEEGPAERHERLPAPVEEIDDDLVELVADTTNAEEKLVLAMGFISEALVQWSRDSVQNLGGAIAAVYADNQRLTTENASLRQERTTLTALVEQQQAVIIQLGQRRNGAGV